MLRDDFASIMVRGQNNMIQKNMVGEQDLWTRTTTGSMLTYLKMFPLTAIPKQMMRNARFMDNEALGVAMYGMAVAYVALSVRDAMNGKDRSVSERSKAAFAYSNMFGWVPMVTDPAFTMMGLDEYRIQRYGRHYEMAIAPVEVANRLVRAPGAVLSAVTGDTLTQSDKQSLLAIPFMRTLGIGQWMLN